MLSQLLREQSFPGGTNKRNGALNCPKGQKEERHIKMKRFRFLMVLVVFVIVLALQTIPTQAFSVSSWTPIYNGIWYATGYAASPRLERSYALKVDLQNPCVSLYASHDNGGSPYEVTREGTNAFLSSHGCQVAVNANFWNTATSPYVDVYGLVISNGTVVSYPDGGGWLAFAPDKMPELSYSSSTPSGKYTAVSGSGDPILINGSIETWDPTVNPYTGYGLSSDNRYLIMVCVDGRQSGYSEGCSVVELAQWMLDFGAYNAVRMDGGGSTCMVREDVGVVNSPSDGSVRPVAVSLGVYTSGSSSNPLPVPTPTTGIVVDNPAGSGSSNWQTSSWLTDKYSSDYRYRVTQAVTDKFIWRPNIPATGNYNVYMCWPTNSSWSTRATGGIYYNGGSQAITLNQATNGGQWNYLGMFNFAAGTSGTVELGCWVGEPYGDAFVCADAVWFEPVSSTEVLTVDNPQGVCSANWSTGTSLSGKYGNDYRYRLTQAVGDKFVWRPTITTAGSYDVYARWPASSSWSTRAAYGVYYNGGNQGFSINQTINGGQWNYLGTYPFAVGTSGTVQLGCWVGEPYGDAYVCADAVKLELVPPSTEIIIDNPQGSGSANWSTGTSLSGKYGTDYRYRITQAVTDKFIWRPTITTAGNYNVYMWWPASSSWSTRTTGGILYNGGSQSLTLNQTTNGGQWNYLGTHPFAVGTSGTIELGCYVGQPYGDAYVCADAVKLTLIQDPDIIIDNPQGSGSSNWSTGTSLSGKYGTNYRYRITQAVTDKFIWRPTITTAGNYDVYAWWPASSSWSTRTTGGIYYNGGSQAITLNQTINGGQWNYLGTYPFAVGTSGTVEFGCWVGEPYGNAYVCADAVGFRLHQ